MRTNFLVPNDFAYSKRKTKMERLFILFFFEMMYGILNMAKIKILKITFKIFLQILLMKITYTRKHIKIRKKMYNFMFKTSSKLIILRKLKL